MGTNTQHVVTLLILLILFSLTPQDGAARKGRIGRKGGTKSKILMINMGKSMDKESHNYYNNKDGAKIVSASHFDLEFTLGHKIKFVCTATGNPLPSITWFKDGIEIYAHAYTTVHEHISPDNKIVSKLEIDPAAQMDAGIYECSADNKYSIDRRSFKTDFSIVFD